VGVASCRMGKTGKKETKKSIGAYLRRKRQNLTRPKRTTAGIGTVKLGANPYREREKKRCQGKKTREPTIDMLVKKKQSPAEGQKTKAIGGDFS